MEPIELAFTIIGVILAIILVYAGLKIRKLPIKRPFYSPFHFLKMVENGEIDDSKKRILFIGDSLTHALVSANYFELVKQKIGEKNYHYINAGINDQLVWHVLQRLDEIIECKPDHIVILIGTNDCNDSRDLKKAKKMKRFKKLPELPTKELFTERYNILIDQLKKRTYATIGCISIPILSEVPNSKIYKYATEFSEIIKEISIEKEVGYIPLHETMVKYLHKHPSHPRVTFKYQQTMVILGIIRHLVFNQSLDKISQKYNFTLLTDHIHFNSKSGEILSDLVVEYLKTVLE